MSGVCATNGNHGAIQLPESDPWCRALTSETSMGLIFCDMTRLGNQNHNLRVAQWLIQGKQLEAPDYRILWGNPGIHVEANWQLTALQTSLARSSTPFLAPMILFSQQNKVGWNTTQTQSSNWEHKYTPGLQKTSIQSVGCMGVKLASGILFCQTTCGKDREWENWRGRSAWWFHAATQWLHWLTGLDSRVHKKKNIINIIYIYMI